MCEWESMILRNTNEQCLNTFKYVYLFISHFVVCIVIYNLGFHQFYFEHFTSFLSLDSNYATFVHRIQIAFTLIFCKNHPNDSRHFLFISRDKRRLKAFSILNEHFYIIQKRDRGLTPCTK